MIIRDATEKLISKRALTLKESQTVMKEIMEGIPTPVQVGAFLTALRSKGETVEEVAGMALAMRAFSLKVHLDEQLVDNCGTGGTGKNIFNISTTASFVVAGAGAKVAKHGNRGATRASGSFDLLEALAIKINLSPSGVKQCIEKIGIGFMFAQVFHPAMKNVAPIRQELGIRTVFNILGPLTNPARAQSQIIGVPKQDLGNLIAHSLKIIGTTRTMVVHGADELDELAPNGPCEVWEVTKSEISHRTIYPDKLGLPTCTIDDLQGGSAQENAQTCRQILGGSTGPLNNAVILNASAALVVSGKARDLTAGIQQAKDSIESGQAIRTLDKLITLSNCLE